MKISRDELLSSLALAKRRAKEQRCQPLLDGAQSLYSWINAGGQDRLCLKQLELPDEQRQIYLRMMARATATDPNNVDFVND